MAYSRTKNNHIVIEVQKALRRKIEPLLGRNKKFKECTLASLRKSCRPETKTTVNRYVYHDLSM